MTVTSWDEIEKRYLAWDNEKMSHITRFGISEANAIAWLKHAHRNAYKAAKTRYKAFKIKEKTRKEEAERIRKGLIWLKKLSE